MHPGPMNRGVEINDEVADGSSSVILDQVEAGVAVRMAVLYLLASEPGQPEVAGGLSTRRVRDRPERRCADPAPGSRPAPRSGA